MGNIGKWITRGLAIVMFAGVMVYVGACFFVNTLQSKQPAIPDAAKAPYVFTERNTGEQVLAASYTMQGQVYVLEGYWQQTKNGGYSYHNVKLPLDPKIFGPIIKGQRQVN